MTAQIVPETADKAERFTVDIDFDIDGGAVAGWRWPNAGAPPLIFSHANGFCASAYKSMLRRLAGTYDVFAIDLRGHGRTRLPIDPGSLRGWNIFARDLSAVLDVLSARAPSPAKWTLAGHSCGAVISVLAARERRDIAALALIEPVGMPPFTSIAARLPIWRRRSRHFPLVKRALERRAHWPDRDAVVASYARKGLFSTWAPGALDDYLEDGLIDTESGVRLSCDPRWEAAIFAAHAHDFWGAAKAAPAPLSILGADHKTSTLFGGAPRRLERLGAEVRKLAGATHLLPLEAPAEAAAFLAGARRN